MRYSIATAPKGMKCHLENGIGISLLNFQGSETVSDGIG
jgi:hypothetical protein